MEDKDSVTKERFNDREFTEIDREQVIFNVKKIADRIGSHGSFE